MSYDPRAVRLPKEIKTFGATIADKGLRRSYFKSYAVAIAANIRSSASRKRDTKD
jgi:hypothetical protein